MSRIEQNDGRAKHELAGVVLYPGARLIKTCRRHCKESVFHQPTSPGNKRGKQVKEKHFIIRACPLICPKNLQFNDPPKAFFVG